MKRAWLLGTCLLAPMLLMGCSSSPPPDTGTTPPATTAPAESPMTSETPAAPAESPGETPSGTPGETPAASSDATLEPLDPKAPKLTEKTRINFKTDAGDFVVEVYPQAAPNAAKQFTMLCQTGYYDNTPIFRIVPGFVAQFGINWRPDHVKMKEKNIPDEPSLFKLDKGTLCFAKASMPNSASTQVFINFGDNTPSLVPQFSAFGRVVKGMEVVEKFKAVGDPQMGLDQSQLWADGDAYMKSLPDKPNMILKAEVVK